MAKMMNTSYNLIVKGRKDNPHPKLFGFTARTAPHRMVINNFPDGRARVLASGSYNIFQTQPVVDNRNSPQEIFFKQDDKRRFT